LFDATFDAMSDAMFDVLFAVTPDRMLDRKTRILRDLEGRLSAGNLFLAGHFFLPCGIQ
jgi:hypothetical protein